MSDEVNRPRPLQRLQSYLYGTNPTVSSSLLWVFIRQMNYKRVLSYPAMEIATMTSLPFPFFFQYYFLFISLVIILKLINAP